MRDLYVSDLLTRGTSEWNRPLIESILSDLAPDIYLIKPIIYMAEDTYCWLKTKTGSCSVKSGYYAQREESTTQNKSVTARSMVVNAVVAAREWLLAQ
ncbi:hypothetical protein HID58_077309, partial [Brassica napus]